MAQNYVLLERIELNASAASVTFASIPQSGYTDLKVVASARTDAAYNTIYLGTEFNGVTTGYSARDLYGTGSAAASRVPTGTLDPVIPGASSTASVFSNMEFYVPNYTSSAYKSYSADSVTENNGTTAFQALTALLWSNTAAITSIKFTPELGSLQSGSTFSLYGLAATGTTPVIAPKASGGNITTDGTYWYHTFLSSGTFTPATALTCDYLVIAGGGGGGGGYGAGGGAGGYLTASNYSMSATSYPVTVGSGGAGGSSTNGVAGTNSTLGSIIAYGGGYGAGPNTPGSRPGGPGGSGGGAGYASGTAGAATPSGQGYPGGTGPAGFYGGAGGGGAGGPGQVGASQANCVGGAGLSSSITGTAVTRASGGSGYSAAATTGGGGSGNGGTIHGTAYTGGGGGTENNGPTASGGNGGSGIVIIRYTVA